MSHKRYLKMCEFVCFYLITTSVVAPTYSVYTTRFPRSVCVLMSGILGTYTGISCPF